MTLLVIAGVVLYLMLGVGFAALTDAINFFDRTPHLELLLLALFWPIFAVFFGVYVIWTWIAEG